MKWKIALQEMRARYKKFIDNLEWHIKSNKPVGEALEDCEKKIQVYKEFISALYFIESKSETETPVLPTTSFDEEKFDCILAIMGNNCEHDLYCKDAECQYKGDIVCKVSQDDAKQIMELFSISPNTAIEGKFKSGDRVQTINDVFSDTEYDKSGSKNLGKDIIVITKTEYWEQGEGFLCYGTSQKREGIVWHHEDDLILLPLEEDIEKLFDNNFDCYADTWSLNDDTTPPVMVEGKVIPAITKETLIKIFSPQLAAHKQRMVGIVSYTRALSYMDGSKPQYSFSNEEIVEKYLQSIKQ